MIKAPGDPGSFEHQRPLNGFESYQTVRMDWTAWYLSGMTATAEGCRVDELILYDPVNFDVVLWNPPCRDCIGILIMRRRRGRCHQTALCLLVV
jgi:hypothetical protein